jgi:tetratricopeptide (TPR) repeat protein
MDLDSLFQQAVAAHRAGRLPEAERGYLQILAAEPAYTQARYPLGILRAQQGRPDEALELIGAALMVTPHSPEMLFNYGNVLMSVGRFPEALAIFTRALDFDPANGALWANRALVEMRLERFDEALISLDRALAIQPGNANLLQGRADALQHLNRKPEALATLDRLLALRPEDAVAHNNRGNLLKSAGRLEEAIAALDRCLELKPDFAAAFYNRGKALWDNQQIAGGFADLMQSARLNKGEPTWSADPQPHKARHDAEQAAYLRGLGRGGALEDVHIEGGARLSGPAVNPANTAEVERQWRQNKPQIVVIDNLLTPQALEALRRYCWGSTVWRTPYKDGYLGAFPEHGFAAPLLAQIAEEFRTVFPDMCGGHPLKYIWAFKYDSSLSGIGIHADSAAVNVNFWITPDEANLDPDRGGLVVWDKAAPLDWDFERFNGDIAATRAFLAASGAKAVTVPYRANRAVVFDSDLFHETDVIRFRDGYLDRRINVTLLYGNRA